MLFQDRVEAGRRLGRELTSLRGAHPVVLALPRGGVPVGLEVARALGAPLDVLVVRKLGAPGHAEFALGAIAPGAVYVDQSIVRQLGVPVAYLEQIAVAEARELARREEAYRAGRPPVEIAGRVAVLVDDGLATGATVRAAIASLRRRAPARIVVAAPVGAPETIERLRALADQVVCLAAPMDFRAVSLYYDDFAPTSDAEVVRCLAAAS